MGNKSHLEKGQRRNNAQRLSVPSTLLLTSCARNDPVFPTII